MHFGAFSGSGYELNLFIGRSINEGIIGNMSPVKIDIADGIDIAKFFESNGISKELRILQIGKSINGFPRNLTDFTKLVSLRIQDETPPECPLFTDAQYSLIKLIVPDGTINDYREAEGWENFDDIEEASRMEDLDIFIIGSMCNWLPSKEWKFTAYNKEATIFKFITSVPQKIYYSDEFKIATRDWTVINYGVESGQSRIGIDKYTQLITSGMSWNCQLETDWNGVCWFDTTSGVVIFSNDKSFIPDFTEDGVEETFEDSSLQEECLYNLQGIKISSETLAPGIYIMDNGKDKKKLFIK